MSKLWRSLFVALMCLSIATGMLAQTAGFGSISGLVSDPTGAVVEGAKVIVENPSKGIRRELTTTSAGTFNVPALVPAAGYRVIVDKAGFKSYEVKDITVRVGEAVTLSTALQIGAAGSTVEVTSEAPIIDVTKTGTSNIVDSKQILELPTNGRRVDAFVLLTPGVVSDGVFGLLSFRGNPGGNTFLTDGNDTTNQYYNENAGRTRTYNISQDAVQEFQVVTSNFSAEYGRASGGVVNTVTRSGSNTVHGSAYEFFRNRTLNAIDRTTANGLYPNGINPPEWRHQAGLSIGGPIYKDKLFYFFNGELMRREAPIVSSNIGAGAGNNLFNGDGTQKAACGAPATAAQCTAAVNYLKSRVLPTLIPRKMDNNLLFGKIDWRPTQSDTISFSGNYVDFRSPNGIQTQLSLANGNAIGNNADTNVFNRTGRVSWTRVITPRMLNEVRFGVFKDRQFDPASDELLPTLGNGDPLLSGLTVNSVSNLGYATDYPRLNPSELRLQFADTLSWSIGSHNLKFGFDFSNVQDYVNILRSRYGSFTYPTLTAFAQDYSDNTTNVPHYQSFTQAFGNPIIDLTTREVSFFATDEWRLTPKLTIRPGIRYEYTQLPQPETCSSNPTLQDTCRIPGTSGNVAPRLGIAYAINDKTTVRAGYGIFYNRYTTATIQNLFISNGVYQQTIQFAPAATATQPKGPMFGSYYPIDYASANGLAQTNATIIVADPNFRNPYSQQAELAIEREIANNTSLSVSYVWSRGLHLLQTRNDNVLDPTTSTKAQIRDAAGNNVGDPITIPVYTALNPKYNGYRGPVFQLQTAGNSYYNGLLVQLSRRYSSWFQGSLSYTWSHAIDYNQGGSPTFGSAFSTSVENGNYRAEKGSSSLDARHRLVINAVVSPTFMKNEGVLAKYLVNGWQLAVLNVNESSKPLVPTVSVSTTAPGTLNPTSTRTLNGLSGSTRVPWESISALEIGAIFRTDARLSKTFPVTERVNVALGFEAFNIFNHLIPSGRQTAMYNASYNAGLGQYILTPNAQYGSLNATQATPDGTTARRAQAVVRINF